MVTVYAVSFRKGLIFIALLLAIPAMMERTVLFRTGIGRYLVLVNSAYLSALRFDVFVSVVMFRRIFARDRSTAEIIFGAYASIF